MCMVCDVGFEKFDEFQEALLTAQQGMREVERVMLSVVQMSPEHKKKYDHFHKALVRARKDYNRVQYLREVRTFEGQHAVPTGKSHGDSVQIPFPSIYGM